VDDELATQTVDEDVVLELPSSRRQKKFPSQSHGTKKADCLETLSVRQNALEQQKLLRPTKGLMT